MRDMLQPDKQKSKRMTIADRPLVLWGVPVVFMLVHTLQAWLGLEWLGDILAPLMLGWALFVLFPVIRSRTLNPITTHFFAAGIFAFALLEIAWASMNHFLHLAPAESLVMTALYLLTNLLFLIAIVQFAWLNFRHWPTVQFVLNLVTVSLILAGVVSYLYLESQWMLDWEHLIAQIYLGIDTFSMAIFLAMVISTLPQQTDRGFWLIFVALLQFYAADYLFIVQILNNQYVPNGLADWLYIASILLLANGIRISYHRAASRQPGKVKAQVTNAQSIALVIMILSLPILTLVARGIKAIELLYFAAILIIYLLASLSNLTRQSLEKLLKERTDHNNSLQRHVLERTRQLQDLNDELNHTLCHDALTGLFSRNYFLALVDREILKAEDQSPVYLAIVDLHRFRTINDLYSQEIGDQVLQDIARRLNQFQDDQSTIAARLGGDEFALLCNCSPDQRIVEDKLDQLLKLLEAPIEAGPYTLQVGIRIGVASYPENAANRTDLLKCAKTAVEQAKAIRSNAYSFYDQTTHATVRRRNDVEMALRHADTAREFSLHFQPQYSVDGQSLIGLEALLRWNSPVLGSVSPSEFIPAAEETGEILRLGHFAMLEAMRQITNWNTRLGLTLHMGINISPLQLENGDFLSRVKEGINQTKVNPASLVFEITEGLAMLSPETCSDIFSQLKKLGIAIAIDDFGTGYSTYAYLKQFNVDYLKIDKKLIDTLAVDSRDAEIIQGMIAMARALKILTVAEGVEHTKQAKLLEQLGCDAIQGYLYGRPMPIPETDRFLSQHVHALSGGSQDG
ncbi:MAG: phosphodiesterase [Clostridia bacterium]|nr:phosphodiesterase [Clostridia bacterium]